MIDQAAGQLAFGKEAWINIPPGALDGPVEIIIVERPSCPNLPANYRIYGSGYSCEPHHYEFNLPVSIYVPYDTSATDPSFAKLDDNFDGYWEFLASGSYTDGVATCNTTYLGIHAVTNLFPLEEVYVSTNSRGIYASGERDAPLPSINRVQG